MKHTYKIINIDNVSHVENYGRDFQLYRIYLNTRQPNGDRNFFDLEEKAFYQLDEIFNYKLSLKVIN